METENQSSKSCKIADFFRPMTKYVLKEDVQLSFGVLEDENAAEPCCSFDFKDSKKVNLLRFAAIAGGIAVLVGLISALCGSKK